MVRTAVQYLEQLTRVYAAAPAQHVQQVYLPGTATHVVQEGGPERECRTAARTSPCHHI